MNPRPLLGLISSVALITGCQTTIPVDGSSANCLTCAAKQPSVPAIAVTRPPMCNDYPVGYRVQTPETEPRVRAIDRVELTSNGTLAALAANCPR